MGPPFGVEWNGEVSGGGGVDRRGRVGLLDAVEEDLVRARREVRSGNENRVSRLDVGRRDVQDVRTVERQIPLRLRDGVDLECIGQGRRAVIARASSNAGCATRAIGAMTLRM